MPVRRVVIDHVSVGMSDPPSMAFGPEGLDDFAVSLDPDGHNVEAVHHG